jgi:exoribonuclease R
VPSRRIRVLPTAAVLAPALDRIRAELEVPAEFPPEELAEAAAAASRGPQLPPGAAGTVEDRRDLPFVTIDPPGSRDLDQAYFAERVPSGYRVNYAIADVAAFVTPGGPLDAESRRRGVTLYQPDRRTPLYPEALGQGAASLLPSEDRQALLWTITLDRDGMPMGDPAMRRATVRSRAAMSYPEVQAEIGRAHGGDDPLQLLGEIGRLREQREIDRGGVSLRLPTQRVVISDGHADLAYDAPLPVEGWNAEISLLTGIVAAAVMLGGRVGILRTLPPPDESALALLRHTAHALGVDWPAGMTYAAFVRSLDPADPHGAALLHTAARALRGAGYTAFDGETPADPGHAAVASTYAHVTAPLRRLADRFANEVVAALVAGKSPPDWAATQLLELPPLMTAAGRRERELERSIIDEVESLVLANHVGEEFDATVVSDNGKNRRTVQIADPAVVGRLDADVEPGTSLRVRLLEADPDRGSVRFAPA